jgi:uncharacterized protein (TIGR02171 family)
MSTPITAECTLQKAACQAIPFRRVILLLLIFVELWGILPFCSPQKPIANQFDRHPGMHKIISAGKTFIQGANDSAANADEKPPMVSGFTYDYWIDTALVTQKEFYDITGNQPVNDTSSYGSGEDYPVYFVSWFDAILFCNAKSKKEKLDTVYAYYGGSQTHQGSVYSLVDVHVHYERDGFRLPTESEWEFAAREGTSSLPFPHLQDSTSAQSFAWYAANASNRTHPVASLSPNSLGLYDMAGNVFEWMNDWKGFYRVSHITNSIGVERPNNSNERVVKGGSFKTGFSSLRPSHRKAIYETSQSTAVAYIGFRCARGVIASPRYISMDTLQKETNPVSLMISNCKPFLGTYRARMVFVNVTHDLRTLSFVDFGGSYPMVRECKDFTSVYVPVISPNGKYAAFCTRNDGLGGKAAIYIRNLDALDAPPEKIPSDSAFGPRWWVDPVSKDTCLLFTNSSIDNASSQWQSTGTFKMKVAGGKPVGALQQLTTGGGFHDGMSAGGGYMVTGFTKLIMRDMAAAQDRQIFLSPRNGKAPSGSAQVCNASICPDSLHSDRCLFIDFGCQAPMVSTLTGSSYGIHEYLFIGEYSGAILSWYRHPDNEASWDYPEWSNADAFAVSCARNNRDEAHAIYFVNLHDSSYCKVAEGTELAHPFLWVNKLDITNDDSLDLDSLGNYNDPPLGLAEGHFARRMHDFWPKHKDMRIVFVGSSHTANAIDPNFFSGTPVYNMAIEGGAYRLEMSIIQKYLLNHCPSLQLIGCDVIPGCLNLPNLYTEVDDLTKGYAYDKNHDFWKTGLPANFENLVQLAPVPDDPRIDTLGMIKTECLNWGDTDLTVPRWTIDDPTCQSNFRIVKEVARSLANKKIHFLLYTTPESPNYRSFGIYGPYGATFETGKAIVAQFKSLEDSFPPYFHFYNGNLDGYHDYADSEAASPGHVCYIGAKKFSVRMDSVVHAILGR